MNLEYTSVLTDFLKHPYSLLTILIWLTYWYSLRTGMVSDDHMGLGDYDGNLQTSVSEAIKNDSKLSETERKSKLDEFNKKFILKRLIQSEYGMISRWVRFHICGGNYPSKNKLPDGKHVPLGKSPARHHFLSVFVTNVAVILGYKFFAGVFGAKVAFITFALFVVSPIGTQAIAWISAIGYPLSLFWMFLILNFVQWYYSVDHSIEGMMVLFALFIVLDIMAINALFIAMALPAILIFFGYYPFAILSALISIVTGLRIVKHTITIRSDAFKEQDMGHLTKLRPRRFIVACKTILYYLELLVWPNRLGLYHEWGNHPSPDNERDDRRFLLALLATGGLVGIFLLTPILAVKLGILWFFSFIFIFLNWITIQQFVTERYLWVPSIGFYLIVAHFLQDYPLILSLVGGIYICRTWLHLPTYDDELRFYLSNTWNYQNSETAYANLGCTWIRLGAVGSALDAWHASSKANPDYDVPLANIYFHYRSNAMLDVEHGNYENAIEKFKVAHKYIDACCKCSVRHFKDDWQRELDQVTAWIKNPITLIIGEKKRLTNLEKTLMERRAKPDEDYKGIDESLSHIKQRMIHIEALLNNVPKGNMPDESKINPMSLILPGSKEARA